MADNFGPERRILKTDEFSSVFRLRPVFKTEHFVLYVRPNSLAYARLGVVAGKRYASRSVTRNSIKRAVREGFRQSELLKSLGLDCVVRLSKPLGSKEDPARTPAMQALLANEVRRLFSKSDKFKAIVDENGCAK